MKRPRRILIYRIGNLGDTVCAMPTMVAIKRLFPDAWIGLLTNKEEGSNPDSEEILKGNDFLHEIITYHPSRLWETGYLTNFLKKLRSLQIDLLVYLAISKITRQRLIRDWFFFRAAGCQRSVGFNIPKPIGTVVNNGIKLPVFAQEVDRLMSLLTPLGSDPSIVDFRLPINEKHKQRVDGIWKNCQLEHENPIVAICPGAKFPSKCWEVKRFSEVARILKENFGAKILLIGGSGETTSGKEIIKEVKNSIVNLIGKTSYMESAEIIKRCNLLVSNDCGPVHLSAAVGTPVVGIYSSRDFPGAWHPWGNIHTVLRNDSVSCRFCFKTDCEGMECMNGITVEQVIEACQRYL